MTAQKGKDLLLKVDSDGEGDFTTVAGLRARTLAFNAATVDITDQESAGRWRELLEGAGLKTARITGSGIFKDAASDETLRAYFFAGTVRDWQVIVPDVVLARGNSSWQGHIAFFEREERGRIVSRRQPVGPRLARLLSEVAPARLPLARRSARLTPSAANSPRKDPHT